MKVDVRSDDLFGMVDRSDPLESDTQDQDERVVVAHQPVRAVGRDRGVVDVVAAEQCADGGGGGGGGRGGGAGRAGGGGGGGSGRRGGTKDGRKFNNTPDSNEIYR